MSTLCCEQGIECSNRSASPDGGLLKQLFFAGSPLARRASTQSPFDQASDKHESPDHQDPCLQNRRFQKKQPPTGTQLPAIRPRLFNRLTLLLLSGWIGIVGLAFEMAAKDTTVAQLPVLEVFLRSLL